MRSGPIIKSGAIILLFILLFFLGAQIYSFVVQTRKAEKDAAELQTRLEQAKDDQNKLTADMDYYLNPENLKKELKGRFNLKDQGEKMLILVNKNNSSTLPSSSAPQ